MASCSSSASRLPSRQWPNTCREADGRRARAEGPFYATTPPATPQWICSWCRRSASASSMCWSSSATIDGGSYRSVSPSVTSHPTAEWIARQITDAFPWTERVRAAPPPFRRVLFGGGRTSLAASVPSPAAETRAEVGRLSPRSSGGTPNLGPARSAAAGQGARAETRASWAQPIADIRLGMNGPSAQTQAFGRQPIAIRRG
jgi:hypothetical protein